MHGLPAAAHHAGPCTGPQPQRALTAALRRPRRARAACCPRPRPAARAARCAWCRCTARRGRRGAGISHAQSSFEGSGPRRAGSRHAPGGGPSPQTTPLARPTHRTRPSPWHVPHGVNCSPVPPQAGQVATCWNMPRGVRTACTTWPAPLHVEQVEAEVPAFLPLPEHVPQSSSRLTSISLLRGGGRARGGRRGAQAQQRGMAEHPLE